MDTFICKVSKKHNDAMQEVLEDSSVIYNSLMIDDGVMYTIYCTRDVACDIKNKGFNLIEI